MEYLVFMAAMLVFVAVIFGMEAVRSRKEEQRFIAMLREDFCSLYEKVKWNGLPGWTAISADMRREDSWTISPGMTWGWMKFSNE